MSIDADRLAHQVKLAYDFIDALHRQALGLIKDVETQIGEAAEALECLQSAAATASPPTECRTAWPHLSQ